MQTRLGELESVGRAAFDAVVALEEWLGGAGRRQAATDAWRRLEIKLMALDSNHRSERISTSADRFWMTSNGWDYGTTAATMSCISLCLARPGVMPAGRGWQTFWRSRDAAQKQG